MNFGQKILMLFIGLIALGLVLVIVVGGLYQRISLEQNELIQREMYADARAQTLYGLIQKVESAGAHFIITGKEHAFHDFLAAHSDFDRQINMAVSDPKLSPYRAELMALSRRGKLVESLRKPFFIARLKGKNSAEATAELLGKTGRPELVKLQQELWDLERKVKGRLQAATEKAARLHRKAIAILTGIAVLSFAAVVTIFFFLYGFIKQKHKMDVMREEISTARKDAVEIIAHDLRNPLGTAEMSLQILSSSDLLADQKKALDIASRSIHHAFELINLILDCARIEAGHLVIEKAPCDFGSMWSELGVLFQAMCRANHIALQMESSGPNRIVDCDKVRIGQALSNLVGNAIKFSPPQSTVTLSAALDDRGFVISVKDCGPGIADDLKEKIFDRYWQAGKHRYAGIGLGLAISKSIVDAHGGRIWVENADSGGSIFYFSIPC